MPRPRPVKKTSLDEAPRGPRPLRPLLVGARLVVRLREGPQDAKDRASHETVGFVLSGRARLEIEGHEIALCPGDCWLVPKGARHRLRTDEPFAALEASTFDPADAGPLFPRG
jgi:uncharacterized RmlC-like cupin family protein